MVRIRLARVGLKKQPSYRIVVTDKRNARDGKYLEIIGHYNPRTRPDTDAAPSGRSSRCSHARAQSGPVVSPRWIS